MGLSSSLSRFVSEGWRGRTYLQGRTHDDEPLDRLLDVDEGRLDGVGQVVEPLQLLAEHGVHALVPPHRVADLRGLHVELRGDLKDCQMLEIFSHRV